MPTLTCPRCAPGRLDPALDGDSRAWTCASCGGHALTVTALRQALTTDRFAALWRATLTRAQPGRTPCPSCRGAMLDIEAPQASSRAVRVDLCRPCQLFWFDLGERDAVAGGAPAADQPRPPVARGDALSLDARRLLAEEQLRLDGERRHLEGAGDRLHDRWLVGEVVAGFVELLVSATH
jgi:hypothetical protein